jgi:hypothetical protein
MRDIAMIENTKVGDVFEAGLVFRTDGANGFRGNIAPIYFYSINWK